MIRDRTYRKQKPLADFHRGSLRDRRIFSGAKEFAWDSARVLVNISWMTFPGVTIREFTIMDYAAAVSLWKQVEGVEIAEGDLQDDIHKFLTRNFGLSRVAEADGRIVGAALCGHDCRRGWIYHLAVLPQYQGRGLGAALANECVKGLRDAAIKRAIVLVAGDNPRGREFWRRIGWEEIDGAVPMARDV